MAQNDQGLLFLRYQDILDINNILLIHARALREDNRHAEAGDWLALIGRNMEEIILDGTRYVGPPRRYRSAYRSSAVRGRPLQYRPIWTVQSAYPEPHEQGQPYPIYNRRARFHHVPGCPLGSASALTGGYVGSTVVTQQPIQGYPVSTRPWYSVQLPAEPATPRVFSQSYPVAPPPSMARPWNGVQQRPEPPQINSQNLSVLQPPQLATPWNGVQQRTEPVATTLQPGSTISGSSNTVPAIVDPYMPTIRPQGQTQPSAVPTNGPSGQTDQNVVPTSAPWGQTQQSVQQSVATTTAPRGQMQQSVVLATVPHGKTKYPATATKKRVKTRKRNNSSGCMIENSSGTQIYIPDSSYFDIVWEDVTRPATPNKASFSNGQTFTDTPTITDGPTDGEQPGSSSIPRENVKPPTIEDHQSDDMSDHMGHDFVLLEVLNTMRDALFSQDGWGCQHVNQDTNWEVPGSPEPQGTANAGGGGGGGAGGVDAKPDGAGSHGAGPNGSWKAQTMNNGTELWETNIRNGGGGPTHHQQQQQILYDKLNLFLTTLIK